MNQPSVHLWYIYKVNQDQMDSEHSDRSNHANSSPADVESGIPLRRHLLQVVFNETGQMSIFIALIFQVLFVFFAMVINVGLLVHDKINLQNAVDLAAYYGAQRQAEILNEIAHINYQIRQDYKLLTWRYRVLGTLGRHGSAGPTEPTLPPARKNSPGSLSDKPWINPDYGDETPSICISNDNWKEMVEKSSEEESYCFRPYNSKIPKIPDVVIIASFVPGVAASAAFTKMAQDQQSLSCRNAGPRNWAFTMQMLYAYKLAVATRKELIWELRKNLIADDPKDRFSQSVKEGVLKTLTKNLTVANSQGLQSNEFEVVNGLANENCSRDEGEFVLPEIRTAPTVLYTTYNCEEGTSYDMIAHHLTDGLDQAMVNKYDPSGLYRNLAKGEPEPKNPLHSSLGFEKNPWCMAYYGVKAKTKAHKPFAPFGQPITIEARAFAQPFGGRIGPWYKSRWTKGAPESAEGERVDPLTTPRLLSGGGLDSGKKEDRLPNFSRFPGDTLGLKSEIALGAQNSIIRSYGPPQPKGSRLSFMWYTGFDQIPGSGDVLVSNGNPTMPLRRAEISAIAPDLFDATYYSIDPRYSENYMNGPERFAGAQPIFGQQVRQIPDLGGNLSSDIKMNVETQISQSPSGGFDPAVFPKLYYVIRSWTHLLTGWVQKSVQNFEFPVDRYGKCEAVASDQVMIPGRCRVGGRVGYSVRLISRSHLMSDTWKVGGESEAPGSILNPPDPDF